MGTFGRYLLFQIPGWIAVGVLVVLADSLEILSARVGTAILALWVVKDFALYPLVRAAYEKPGSDGKTDLAGARGTALTDISPRGSVRVRGELWRAELAATSPPVRAGEEVEVVSSRGLTLVVRNAGREDLQERPR
ncbi:MAG: hypothetical protein KatS3mg076_2724 [Candidatus Binatia bacterium]|nr:MAG: hypothetical protein KatS3mg076_2724 [Candidatus Binatia bacterium]